MGKEIERKYLVKNDAWKNLGKTEFYQQAYLVIEKSKTIRIRTIDKKAYLTIKNAAINFSRDEFEYQIPIEDAKFMIENLCEKPVIEKFRTKIELNNLIWEVDEFLGENKGLIIAEVELEDENQKIILPEWIGKEVTGDHRYNNSYLVKHPFSYWVKVYNDKN